MQEEAAPRSRNDRAASGGHLRYWHRLAWLAALVHGLVSVALSLTRFHTGKVSLLDIGLFDQALWTALEYGTPTVSAVQSRPVNPLAEHFSAVVFSMLPVYRFFPMPELLLVLQSALVAGTGVLVFWTCMKLLQNPRAAFLWSLVYLLNPFMVSAAVWDFHEKSFALPAITLAFFALIDKRRLLFVSALILLVLCREHYGVAAAGFGLLWMRVHGHDRFGPMVTGAGVVVAILVLFFVMPSLNPVEYESTPLDYGGRYSWLNQPLPDAAIAGSSLVSPGLSYLFVLLVSVGGAALMSPAFLLPAIADLVANLLSANPMPRSVFAYHSMALVPIFVIASARTCARLTPRAPAFVSLALIASSVLTYLALPLPVPGAANVWQIQSVQLRRDRAVGEISRRVTPDMSVSVQANIGGYFSQRLLVYRFPDKLDETQAVILHLKFPYDSFRHTPFDNPYPMEQMPLVFDAMEQVLEGQDFGLVYWADDWLLAIKGAEDQLDREIPRRRLESLRRAYKEEVRSF